MQRDAGTLNTLGSAWTLAAWRTCWQGALLAGAVWLLGRIAPSVPVRIGQTLWWLVCLKLAVGLFWLEPLKIRVLPAPRAVWGRRRQRTL